MLCVETVECFVLVNEAYMGHIVPGRGRGQGDPLFSIYLFCVSNNVQL